MASQLSTGRLAFSATWHCLLGCGLGEVSGIIIGNSIGFPRFLTVFIAVILGLIFGFLLGIMPLLRVGKTVYESFRIIFLAEFISIVVMEIAEILIELYLPGVMSSGVLKPKFWFGMTLALIGGFIATYPINYLMVKKGVRHRH